MLAIYRSRSRELSAKRQFHAELGRLRYDWRSQRSRLYRSHLAGRRASGRFGRHVKRSDNRQIEAGHACSTPAKSKFAARKFARSMIIAHCCVVVGF